MWTDMKAKQADYQQAKQLETPIHKIWLQKQAKLLD